MFLLNNNPLPTDTQFTVNGIQYPANWLRLTSAEEKAAIGITEVADPVRADDRFYWNGMYQLHAHLKHSKNNSLHKSKTLQTKCLHQLTG